jgi:urate oxidase
MKLLSNRYGKARVRVMKILREGATHTIKEIDVAALLTGDFAASYTSADNSKVVATDTIKNTVNVLAKQHLDARIERFGLSLGQHFLARYPQVESASSEIFANGLAADGNQWQAASAFLPGRQRSEDVDARRLHARRGDDSIGRARSRDPEIDRLRLGRLPARRIHHTPGDERSHPRDLIRRDLDMVERACRLQRRERDHPRRDVVSVREQLQPVRASERLPDGRGRTEGVPRDLARRYGDAEQALPLINLKPFGLENDNEVFVPTDEPHGQIEGSVVRDE